MAVSKSYKISLTLSYLIMFSSVLFAEEYKYSEGFEGKENPVSPNGCGEK